MIYWLVYGSILLLGAGGLIALMVRWQRSQTSPWRINLLLVILTLLLTCLALEFYFKVFFAETNEFDTLARRNWRDRYYTGTFNSFGYRDKEWTADMVAGKTRVLVAGDSFVEGVGIEYLRDRFPDLLADKLGSKYAVFNLGRRGAGTSREIKDIINYPYKPNILILSYFINDIDDIAIARGITRPPKMPEVSAWLSPLVNNSYLFNFVYWRWIRLTLSWQTDMQWQWRWQAYDDPNAWWLHQQELISIYDGAKSERISLIVVVFPNLAQVAESRHITQRIVDLYRQRGVPVLDVADLVKDMPAHQLVVNSVDAHANERVHSLVAEALYNMMTDLGLVK